MKCGECDTEYIGEIARTLGVRFKEHTSITVHKYTLADVKILVKEDSEFKRKVNNKNQPALNRD